MSNETYIQYITEDVIEVTENGQGRPKLMKHELIKTVRGFVITNLSNNNSYFVSFPEDRNSYNSLNDFLIKINALDDRTPLSITGIDSNYINQQLDTIGRVTLWIPANQMANTKQNVNKMYYENVNPNVEEIEELKKAVDVKIAEVLENTATLSELENRIAKLEENI